VTDVKSSYEVDRIIIKFRPFFVSDAGWKFIGLLCEKTVFVLAGVWGYENTRIKKKGKKERATRRASATVQRRGRCIERRERERGEQNERSTLVSIFSSKNNRNECIWYGTEHEIRILYTLYTIYHLEGTEPIGLHSWDAHRRKKKSPTQLVQMDYYFLLC